MPNLPLTLLNPQTMVAPRAHPHRVGGPIHRNPAQPMGSDAGFSVPTPAGGRLSTVAPELSLSAPLRGNHHRTEKLPTGRPSGAVLITLAVVLVIGAVSLALVFTGQGEAAAVEAEDVVRDLDIDAAA